MKEIYEQERYRDTKVISYNQNWPLYYDKEARRIQNILKDELVAIYHIGSTAIPGIKAKPVIDILVVVNNIDKLKSWRKDLESLGYYWMGEYSIPGRRYLWRIENKDISFHLQCFQVEDENIYKSLAFLDYLRTYPQKALAYSDAKEKANKLHPNDAHAYSNEKKEVVETLLQEALEWKK